MRFLKIRWLFRSFYIFVFLLSANSFTPRKLQAEERLIHQNSKLETVCSSKRFCLQSVFKPGHFNLLSKVIIVNKKGKIIREYRVDKIKGALKQKVITYLAQNQA